MSTKAKRPHIPGPHNLTLDAQPPETHTCTIKALTRMFTAACLQEKRLKCPSTVERMHKLWNVHMVEDHTAVERTNNRCTQQYGLVS